MDPASRPASALEPYTDEPPLREMHSDSHASHAPYADMPPASASTSTFARDRASGLWAPPEKPQYDQESDDEDWDVYDDFNNIRPLSKGPVAAGLTDSAADIEARGMRFSTDSFDDDELVPLAAGARPQRALLANAFGFDAQNSDPRTWDESQRAAASLAKERNAIHQPNPEMQLELADHGIEMITVPALGAEYTDEERKRLTAPYRRRQKRKAKQRSCAAWRRGDTKVLGLDCRAATFITFFACIALGLTLYFVIPRVPTFDFRSVNPLDAYPDGGSMDVGHNPLNFSMTMMANMRADNKGSYVPIKIHNMDLKVRDQTTNALVGEGKIDTLSIAARKKKEFQFPIDFVYRSINLTGDQTFLNFYHGCGPKWPGSTRPVLKLQFSLQYNVAGMIGKKGSGESLTDIACPFTLQPTQ